MFSQETGSPGVLRFFQPPLAAEMSWLLPFALLSLFVIVFQSRIKLPVELGAHLGLLLWGGWLMTCVVFFSMVSGIFHSYYVVMLAPALGRSRRGWIRLVVEKTGREVTTGSGWLLTLGVAVTVAFQIFLAWQHGVNALWMPLAFVLVALATILLFYPIVAIGDVSAARCVLAVADCVADHSAGLVCADGVGGRGREPARRVRREWRPGRAGDFYWRCQECCARTSQ